MLCLEQCVRENTALYRVRADVAEQLVQKNEQLERRLGAVDQDLTQKFVQGDERITAALAKTAIAWQEQVHTALSTYCFFHIFCV